MLHMSTHPMVSPASRDARFSFLPALFGADYVNAEACIYAYAAKYIRDYNGGEWTFNQLPDGAGYLAPDEDRVTVFNADNGFEGEMSGDAAGITITALVLNHRSWMHDHHDERDACRHYIRRYEQLMSIVATNRESRAIYRALD